MLQDTELMRFVFDRDPTSVQKALPEFKLALEDTAQTILAQNLKFNIYETEFYSKVDGSIDFGKTSSCFQIMEDENVVDLKTSETIFADNDVELKKVFDEFNVEVEVSVIQSKIGDYGVMTYLSSGSVTGCRLWSLGDLRQHTELHYVG